MSRRRWSALVIAAVTACSGSGSVTGTGSGSGSVTAAAAPIAAQDSDAAHLLDRVAVVGASLSAGLAAPPIATTLRAGLRADTAVLDVSSITFFQAPLANGRAQVDAAIAHRPSLTLALDFLFWFAYASASPDQRRASLAEGLALLAPLPGTLVLGDLPDMRNASARILDPSAVPSPAELAAMNAQIRAWAAARPHTLVLPFAEWTAPLVTGADVELAPGERVPARDLMFLDGLHPNALGAWHLLDLVDRALEHDLAVPAAALRLPRPAT
jgi:hypothetical protein